MKFSRTGMQCVLLSLTLLASGTPAFAGKSLSDSRLGYSAYAPSAVAADQALPVLMVLPGYGISSQQALDLWAFSAEKSGFITIAMDMDYDQVRRPGDAQERIERALESIGRSYSIDRKRVVLAGTYAGGLLAISLGLRYPEYYQAVAVAGGGGLNLVDWGGLANARKQRFFMAHGEKDKNIPVSDFSATVRHLKDYGARVESRIYPDADSSLPGHAYDQLVEDLHNSLGHP